MTANQIFEAALIELNKVQAPSLLLEDYNYFINKAINQYINKTYNTYDMNQQKSDDIRVLKSTAVLSPTLQTIYNTTGNQSPIKSPLYGSTYEVDLPDDYLHILNCIVEYQVTKNYKCYNAGSFQHFGAKRLTADMFSQVINNYYMRPSYRQPYFYLHNVNTNNNFPTSDNQKNINHIVTQYDIYNTSASVNISDNDTITINTVVLTFKTTVTDPTIQIRIGTTPEETINNVYIYLVESQNPLLIGATYDLHIPNTGIKQITIIPNLATFVITENITNLALNVTSSYIEKVKAAEQRYGNHSKVRMELRYGKDDTLFQIKQVYIDYLKAPQYIRLTQDQVDQVEDNSQVLEFQDYVCQEIVNELVNLLLENASDQRLQTHIPVNQSIAAPQGQQPQGKR